MFRVTPAAAAQILAAADTQSESTALRVAAKLDDDGEMTYGMGFDEERENDHVVECEGLQLLISPHSQALLDHATLDFVELRPGEFQFIFTNPKEGPSGDRPAPGGASSGGGRA